MFVCFCCVSLFVYMFVKECGKICVFVCLCKDLCVCVYRIAPNFRGANFSRIVQFEVFCGNNFRRSRESSAMPYIVN